MLTSVLRVLLINNLESFDIAFMRNEKSYQNINYFFLFSFFIIFFLTVLLTNTLRALVSMTL